MEFTYASYKNMLHLLREEGYVITDYHECNSYHEEDIVILRHDIDCSIEKAVKMAELENGMGVCSTYFVLVSSEFYNVATKKNAGLLKKIHAMGHQIGLHFDEMCYEGKGSGEMVIMAEKEKEILQNVIEMPVTTVSMHRPSKMMLENEVSFPSMINSYSSKFFKEFKYLSDSRMHWRENVEAVIKSHDYHRLHILTHAFWYAKSEWGGVRERLLEFILQANLERYSWQKENFRDLDEFITEEDVIVNSF